MFCGRGTRRREEVRPLHGMRWQRVALAVSIPLPPTSTEGEGGARLLQAEVRLLDGARERQACGDDATRSHER